MNKDNSFAIDFIVRKAKGVKNEGYLSCRLTVNGKACEFSLKEKVLLTQWNKKQECVSGRGRDVNSINEHINDVRYRLNESKRLLASGRYVITCESVLEHFYNRHISQKPPSSGHTMLELVSKHFKLEGEGKLKPGTLKNYYATERYIQKFLISYFKQKDVDLLDFNHEAVLELESYIRTHPLRENDPCLGNGVFKHMERVNKMMGMARDMRWIKENPFDGYKPKKQRVIRERLRLEHFVAIENAEFSNPRLSMIRDLFVFDCYVGVSYIDLMNLTKAHLETIKGNVFCTIYRQKSTELSGIPISEPALQILNRYINSPDSVVREKVFPFISNQEFNRGLKVIAGILNIPMTLNTRSARAFFAKEVNLNNGVPLETVSKMLGHSKISTTKESYADVDEERIISDTALVQQKFSLKKNAIAGPKF